MIAVSDPMLATLSPAEALAAVRGRFEAWEITAEGRLSLPECRDELAELLACYPIPISVHAPFSDVNVASVSPRMRNAAIEELKMTIESAAELGAHMVTVHPGRWSPMSSRMRERALANLKDAMGTLDRIAADAGVPVAVENMPPESFLIITRPQQMVELLEGTELGICLDIGHAHVAGELDEFLGLADRVVHLHVHDNDGSRDAHLPLGDGTVPLERTLSCLNGYSGWYVLESRGLDAAARSRDRLMRSL